MDNLSISVGRNRKETKWINKVVTWEKFLSKLEKCEKTDETVAQYAGMAAAAQAEIKDVGGFVGGRVEGGRRRRGSVPARSMITLDMDYAPVDIWDRLELEYNCAMALYSTHKHTTEKPRLRLVVPLNREVSADQYEAIARRVAADIGMGYFDPTTFEVERLMYWPSMPKDGQYVFEKMDGAPMDADRVLARYADWTDVATWPVAPGETRHRGTGAVAPDPRQKTGIVGAFCRVYDPARAIGEFLDGVYALNGDGRYTFSGGTSHGGMIVLPDGQYVKSYHGTDPAGGQNRNAFDLVRLHKFGSLDAGAADGTPTCKLPSYLSMVDFAAGLPDVKMDVLAGARAAFADVEVDADWMGGLAVDRKGRVVGSIENLLIILRGDPGLGGRFALNDFTSREMVRGAVPWDDRTDERVYTDRDDAGLRWHIEKVYGIVSPTKVADAMAIIVHENRYHPVREYLDAVAWDGVERLDGILVDYFGAADNAYVRAVARKTMIGAVARIMEPGIKFDNVLVLVGAQGAGKSTFINKLGGAWYSDNFGRLDGKDCMENIQGVWIMEIGELAGLKRAEIEVIKHFISKQVDQYRPAYGRKVAVFPRQCVFIGSTNNDDFMQDQTGGRRFWPVRVEMAADRVFAMTDADVAGLWAEAVAAWRMGERPYLDPAVEEMARVVQSDHTERDMWLEPVKKYLDTWLPEGWEDMNIYDRRAYLRGDPDQPVGVRPRDKVTGFEIWRECLDGDKDKLSTVNGRRIAQIIRGLGDWKMADRKARIGDIITRYYVRT